MQCGNGYFKIFMLLVLTGFAVLLVPGCGPASAGAVPEADIAPVEIAALDYDLVVVGSDPEGIAAAVSGARNNLSTLLVDTRPAPGGLMTRGWLNSIDMNYGPGRQILNGGIFLEFYNRVGGDSFDVNRAQKVFDDLIQRESKLDTMMSAKAITPVLEKGVADRAVVAGVTVETADGTVQEIRARAVIDATQDADLAAAAGAAFSVGHADIGRPDDLMAATLVFRLSNVSNLDWARIFDYLNNRDNNPLSGCNRWSAWGFAEITQKYRPVNSRIGLRGLNIGRQMDGSVLINAMHIFDVDPLNPESRRAARVAGVIELGYLVEFLKENIPGLKNARLDGAAPELYIRESRHILAEYTLTINDVLENKDFTDRVAFGSYPVDIQSTKPGEQGVVVGNPRQYAVPFRSLVPVGLDNLLVVGRSAGFDSLAHGSARTIPVGMATGQAAGAAAAWAIKNKDNFRAMAYSQQDMKKLQELLNRQGMQLTPFNFANPLADHPDYAALRFMRGLGVAVGGYYNHYGLDDPMPEQKFITSLSLATKATGVTVKARPLLYPETNSLTVYDTAYMFCRYLALNMSKEQAFAYLDEQGFWEQELLQRIRANNNKINNGTGYALIKDFVAWLENGGPTVPAEKEPPGEDLARSVGGEDFTA